MEANGLAFGLEGGSETTPPWPNRWLHHRLPKLGQIFYFNSNRPAAALPGRWV